MYGQLRGPDGRFTPLAVGAAWLLLGAAALPFIPTPARNVLLALLVTGAVILGVFWWLRSRRERYDLQRLIDEPAATRDEPYRDAIPEDEASAPYCGWCDECYPPGTHRCRSCGREL